MRSCFLGPQVNARIKRRKSSVKLSIRLIVRQIGFSGFTQPRLLRLGVAHEEAVLQHGATGQAVAGRTLQHLREQQPHVRGLETERQDVGVHVVPGEHAAGQCVLDLGFALRLEKA